MVFELVLFTLSLHHQNSSLALKEADRVLKREGKLVVIEPSIEGEFQQFFRLGKLNQLQPCSANHSYIILRDTIDMYIFIKA